jgi:hypothetical protein
VSPLRGSRFWVRGSQGSQSFALGLTLAAASRLVEEFHSSRCRLEFHSWIFCLPLSRPSRKFTVKAS